MNEVANTVVFASKAAAKKRLAVFLVVTFALTWGSMIPLGFALGVFEQGEAAVPEVIAPIAISMFFPLVGALVANVACKPDDRVDLCLRPRISGNVRPYLVAWFLPALITLLGLVVFFALNPQWLDLTFGSYLNVIKPSMEASGGLMAGTMPSDEELVGMMPTLVATTVVFSLVIAPFINMIPAFGEEVGWRGMLFPTLCELMSTRSAVVVSGVIWGLWHAPIIAMGHNYGMDYPGFPWAGMIVMVVACTSLGSFLCWLRLRTQSVWSCALSHGAVNAVMNIGVVFCAAGQTLAGPSPLGYVAGIPLLVVGIICWRKCQS